MKLWTMLYAAVWIVFLQFIVALILIPAFPAFIYLHLLLGFLIVVVSYYNYHELRESRAPGRIKRTAMSTYFLSLLMVPLGLLVFLGVGRSWAFPFTLGSLFDLILALHIVTALAILAHAGAVAIAYDMWEDHEFATESLPGEVPFGPR